MTRDAGPSRAGRRRSRRSSATWAAGRAAAGTPAAAAAAAARLLRARPGPSSAGGPSAGRFRSSVGRRAGWMRRCGRIMPVRPGNFSQRSLTFSRAWVKPASHIPLRSWYVCSAFSVTSLEICSACWDVNQVTAVEAVAIAATVRGLRPAHSLMERNDMQSPTRTCVSGCGSCLMKGSSIQSSPRTKQQPRDMAALRQEADGGTHEHTQMLTATRFDLVRSRNDPHHCLHRGERDAPTTTGRPTRARRCLAAFPRPGSASACSCDRHGSGRR